MRLRFLDVPASDAVSVPSPARGVHGLASPLPFTPQLQVRQPSVQQWSLQFHAFTLLTGTVEEKIKRRAADCLHVCSMAALCVADNNSPVDELEL